MYFLTFLLRIGAGTLICLLPLALYLFFLARLNHRRRPTMVSGPWDFFALLLGLSGFMLVGGSVLLSTLDSTWRGMLFSGSFKDVSLSWEANSVIWSTIAGSYLVIVSAGVGWIMYLRQKVTVVYNVDSRSLPAKIMSALKARDLDCQQAAGGIEIVRPGHAPRTVGVTDTHGGRAKAFVAVETFPSMHHATLRWRQSDPLLRKEVEEEIDRLLQQSESPEFSIAGWLMTAAVTLLCLVLGWMLFLVWALLFQPKGIWA